MTKQTNTSPELFIYIAHGKTAFIKILARNLDKTLHAQASQAPLTLVATFEETTSCYRILSINQLGQARATIPVPTEGLERPAFIEYIKNLQETYRIPNDGTMLCCDGNLGEPASPEVSDELNRLISDGTHTPPGIKTGYLVLFSATEACVQDATNYLNGNISVRGYRTPSHLRVGRALETDPNTLKEEIVQMLQAPGSFAVAHLAPNLPHAQPSRWHSFFCCSSNDAAIHPEDTTQRCSTSIR